jgi:putative ABC transport system substrate-binding protein
MRRRDLVKTIVGAATVWLSPHARNKRQTPSLVFSVVDHPMNPKTLVAAFRQELAEAGYVEGQNVQLAFRWAEGRYDRLPELAAELVKAQVTMIVSVGGSPSALTAKLASSAIPVVAVTSAPVEAGLVASLNRPGGNITVVSPSSTLLSSKRLGLLRESVPTATLIGVMLNPAFPESATQLADIKEAARAFGEQISIAYASSERDIDAAFVTLSQQGVGALVSGVDPFSTRDATRLLHWRPNMQCRRSMLSAHMLSPAA